MNILIACHSKLDHSEVQIDNYKTLHYIDTGKHANTKEGQYSDWSDLKHLFYHVVWGINCPVYTFLFIENLKNYPMDQTSRYGLGIDLFVSIWHVLKPGGVFYAPLSSSFVRKYGSHLETKAVEFLTMLDHKWSVSLKEIQHIPHFIDVPEKSYTHVFVFQKPKPKKQLKSVKTNNITKKKRTLKKTKTV